MHIHTTFFTFVRLHVYGLCSRNKRIRIMTRHGFRGTVDEGGSELLNLDPAGSMLAYDEFGP